MGLEFGEKCQAAVLTQLRKQYAGLSAEEVGLPLPFFCLFPC